MLRIWMLCLGMTIGGFLSGQPAVNYRSKKLMKELEREWGFTDPNMVKLDNLTSRMSNTDVQGKYFKVWNKDRQEIAKYIYVGRVNSCRAGGCALPAAGGFVVDSEFFDYFILFNSNLEVDLVRVYNYQATHGHEVTAKGWLQQFNGYSAGKELSVGKDIDAISGATISVHAITEDVVQKTSMLRQGISNLVTAEAE